MVGAHEGEILATERARALEGDTESGGGERGEGVFEKVSRLKQVAPVVAAHIFDQDAEMIEQTDEELLKSGVRIGVLDAFDDLRGFGDAAGVEFEKTVLSAFELFGEGAAELLGACEKRLERLGFERVVAELGEFLGEFRRDLGGAVEVVFEGVEALVVPAGEDLGGVPGEVGNVDLDEGGLTDAVEASDALLEEFGIGGQVEENEVVGELEVAALAADFGAEEDASALGFGEVGGIAVALDEGEALVENAAGQGEDLEEFGVDFLGEGLGLAEEEEFLGGMGAQELRQPPELEREEVGGLVFGGFEFDQVGLALGESGERGAGVAEHDASGSEGVEQFVDEGLARAGIAAGEGVAVVSDAGRFGAEQFAIGGGEWGAIEEAVDGFGDALVVVGFLAVGFEVCVAVGVEQAEAGEVAFGPELLRGGGEQEEARDARGEGLDEGILGAWGEGMPGEVMGLIDDEQIPPGLERLFGPAGLGAEEGEAAEDELAIEEGIGIGLGGFDRLAAFGVKEAEEQVEAAPEFDKPLVDEAFWNQNQNAGGSPREVESVQDEAGLDGFPQTHLVGQKHPGEESGGDFGGDVDLVGKEVDASAQESADGRLAEGGAEGERLGAEFEKGVFIDLRGEEAFLGFAEADGVGELGLGDGAVFGQVCEDALLIEDGVHDDGFAAVEFDFVSGSEADPAQGGGFEGVLAVFRGGGEKDFDPAEVGLENDAEAEFGFGVGDEPLAGDGLEGFHGKRPGTLAVRDRVRKRVSGDFPYGKWGSWWLVARGAQGFFLRNSRARLR
jgi:hypothetical protein